MARSAYCPRSRNGTFKSVLGWLVTNRDGDGRPSLFFYLCTPLRSELVNDGREAYSTAALSLIQAKARRTQPAIREKVRVGRKHTAYLAHRVVRLGEIEGDVSLATTASQAKGRPPHPSRYRRHAICTQQAETLFEFYSLFGVHLVEVCGGVANTVTKESHHGISRWNCKREDSERYCEGAYHTAIREDHPNDYLALLHVCSTFTFFSIVEEIEPKPSRHVCIELNISSDSIKQARSHLIDSSIHHPSDYFVPE
mmetsp:Transcript_25712/g.64721  ORF Transcript_25712/g.64721 Transcript_25712/m.64721 type:complete len:254 (+) Transcript_25712:2846-3607(+)